MVADRAGCSGLRLWHAGGVAGLERSVDSMGHPVTGERAVDCLAEYLSGTVQDRRTGKDVVQLP